MGSEDEEIAEEEETDVGVAMIRAVCGSVCACVCKPRCMVSKNLSSRRNCPVMRSRVCVFVSTRFEAKASAYYCMYVIGFASCEACLGMRHRPDPSLILL